MTFAVLPGMGHAAAPQNSGDSLSYSSDGRNYSLKPPVLFADIAVLVPGDVFNQSFWVKNNRAHPVSILVEPRETVANSAVKIGPVHTKKTKLNAGEAIQIEVQLWLPIEASKHTQDLVELDLGVVVNASEILRPEEADPPKSPDSPPSEQPEEHEPDGLGDTGFNAYIVPLALGMALAGGLLYLTSKRRAQRTNNTEGELP
ncbi:hypothetical protein [Glutamicibacter sp. BW77]|uniref:hypothetical protein n=2 Tax=Glutamicibacter TaxID=1742989 RepID=UPI001141A064|nr:hypothetical protein [Glutamicibacter sp. BW77]